jgi:hypothetical protein
MYEPIPVSEMSSRSPRTRRFRRRSAIAIGLVAVVLLGAEVTAQAIGTRLPKPLRWHSWEAQVKVDAMHKLRRAGGADFVALGDSMMNVALDPAKLVSTMPGDCFAYNASLSGVSPRIMQPWAERSVLPRLRPRAVLIGLQTFDLNENEANRKRFLDRVVESPGAQHEWFSPSILDRVDAAVSRRSALYRDRTVLREPQILLRAVRKRVRPALGEARAVGELGEMRRRLNDHIVPDPRYDQRVRALLRGFRTGGTDWHALEGLLATIKKAGAHPYIVIMPVHPRYADLHPGGREGYLSAKRLLSTLASANGARIIDLDRLDEDRYFADLNHLNGAGTEWFSTTLARELAKTEPPRKTRKAGVQRCTPPVKGFEASKRPIVTAAAPDATTDRTG